MRAGELRRRVTIQQRTTTLDTYGGQSTAWTDFAKNVPCSISPLNGRELMAAQAVNSEVSHTISMRYLAGLTAAMRILYGTRVFNIQGVINVDERNREMTVLASEGLNDG